MKPLTKFFYILCLACTMSGASWVGVAGAADKKVLTEKAMLTKYDVFKLNQASVLLMGAVDGDTDAKKLCGIDTATATALTEPLHSLIDEKVDAYVREHAKKGVYSEATWNQCMSTCDCGVEASILEKVGFAKLNATDKTVYRRVSNLAMEQSAKDIIACAAKTQWFCTSDLLTYAKQQ